MQFVIRIIRWVLFPLSLVYLFIISLRNWLFDWGILKENTYKILVIGVGNLSTGGTGKSPHVSYLLQHLPKYVKPAVLSRGYGRHTRGFLEVSSDSDALTVGDEPLQTKLKFPNTKVVVCERRTMGMEYILQDPSINAVIMDDSFQHRYVKPKINILLTEYHHPFFRDWILPSGNLREWSGGKKRADIIMVTKSPPELTIVEKAKFISKLKPGNKKVFFTSIIYQNPRDLSGNSVDWTMLQKKNIVLLTGIANPEPFVKYISKYLSNFEYFKFQDHHNFSSKEIKSLIQKSKNGYLLTTEKDMMRLRNIQELKSALIYVPISIELLFNQSEEFLNELKI